MTATPSAPASAPDLVAIIQAYNEVTEQLKHSHELLTREVCRLREELREKSKELQRRERLAAVGEMAAGIAHEIRNPLAGIDLYTSLLERDLADRPETLEIVRKVRVGVRGMENIVGEILTFAAPAEPNRRNVLLAGILESVSAQVAPSARAKGIEIETDPQLVKVEILCDPGQIERALLNLMFNAFDAVGEGGRVWVRRGGSRSGNGLCWIIIEDNGPGIARELAQRVFDPFFTTKDAGTGLGLAIVHRIVESHGGHVNVTTRNGGGAAFEVFLPLASRTQQADPVGDNCRQSGTGFPACGLTASC